MEICLFSKKFIIKAIMKKDVYETKNQHFSTQKIPFMAGARGFDKVGISSDKPNHVRRSSLCRSS